MGFFSRFFKPDQGETPESVKDKLGSELTLDTQSAKLVLAEIDIDTAMAAHENWKARLQSFLNGTSTETLHPEVICRDDQCDLGQWLHGPGRQRLGKYPAFSVLVARHQYFHRQASTVVAMVQAGEKAKAQHVLNTSYRHGSNQVLIILKQLKRGLGGEPPGP